MNTQHKHQFIIASVLILFLCIQPLTPHLLDYDPLQRQGNQENAYQSPVTDEIASEKHKKMQKNNHEPKIRSSAQHTETNSPNSPEKQDNRPRWMHFNALSNGDSSYWVEAGANGNGSETNPAGNITYVLTNNVTDGDTVYVKPGTYNTSIGETFPLNITNYENVTLEATGTPADTIINGTGGSYGIYITGDNATLDGFNITNYYDGIGLYSTNGNTITGNIITNTAHGIRLRDASNNTITGNTITNNGDGIYYYTPGDSDNNLITGNTLTNNNYGIDLSGDTNTTITANNISSNAYDGIQLSSSNDTTITGNTITKNKRGVDLSSGINNTVTANNITNHNGFGIEFEAGSNSIITGNTITNNSQGIYLYSGSNNTTITGNTITNNTGGTYHDGIGIRLSSGRNTTITGNTITNNTVEGIKIVDSNDTMITGNNISFNGGAGIQWKTESSTMLTNLTVRHNNILNNSHKGIVVNSGSGNVRDVHIQANIISNNSASGIHLYDTGISHTIEDNEIFNNGGKGVYLQNMDDCVEQNNTITNNSQEGLLVTGNTHTIKCNAIYNNGAEGISLSGTDHLVCRNNIVGNSENAQDTAGGNAFNCSMIGNYWGDYSSSEGRDGSCTEEFSLRISGRVGKFPL